MRAPPGSRARGEAIQRPPQPCDPGLLRPPRYARGPRNDGGGSAVIASGPRVEPGGKQSSGRAQRRGLLRLRLAMTIEAWPCPAWRFPVIAIAREGEAGSNPCRRSKAGSGQARPSDVGKTAGHTSATARGRPHARSDGSDSGLIEAARRGYGQTVTSCPVQSWAR